MHHNIFNTNSFFFLYPVLFWSFILEAFLQCLIIFGHLFLYEAIEAQKFCMHQLYCGVIEKWVISLAFPQVLVSNIFPLRLFHFSKGNSPMCRVSASLTTRCLVILKNNSFEKYCLSLYLSFREVFYSVLSSWATFPKNHFCSSRCVVEWLPNPWLLYGIVE